MPDSLAEGLGEVPAKDVATYASVTSLRRGPPLQCGSTQVTRFRHNNLISRLVRGLAHNASKV